MHPNAELIDLFLAHQQGRSLSADTIRRRRSSLHNLARWIAPLHFADVDATTIEEWIGLAGFAGAELVGGMFGGDAA